MGVIIIYPFYEDVIPVFRIWDFRWYNTYEVWKENRRLT